MPELLMPILREEEKYGVKVEFRDFGQSAFETYQLTAVKASQHAFFSFGQDGTGVTAQAHVRGESVRAALRLKIVTGVTLEQVASMKPYIVEWIADELKKHIAQVVSAPADPN